MMFKLLENAPDSQKFIIPTGRHKRADVSASSKKRKTKGRWYKRAQDEWVQDKRVQVKRSKSKEHSPEERWIKLN